MLSEVFTIAFAVDLGALPLPAKRGQKKMVSSTATTSANHLEHWMIMLQKSSCMSAPVKMPGYLESRMIKGHFVQQAWQQAQQLCHPNSGQDDQ